MRLFVDCATYVMLLLIAGCSAPMAPTSSAESNQIVPAANKTSIIIGSDAAPRVDYGAHKLAEALNASGVSATVASQSSEAGIRRIVVGTVDSPQIRNAIQLKLKSPIPHEGFMLTSCPDGSIAVIGGDDSGSLYGCMELASRVQASHELPTQISFADHPAFVLRGTCIGMQKTYILPGRKVYEYPYTPELFPFFYDKAFWQEYLDFLAQNRMNTLYLWSGHPFASLVKLKDYPYALEVPEDVYQKNVEMFRYIAREADKRGIWVVQMFYNILVSKPFAEKNGISTQLSAPTPLVADYTRKSIAEFVKQYPNVGLMLCLGEALQGLDNQVQWCTQVVLPGVKDGMKEAGLTQEPPVVIRTHATDARVVIPAALKVYKNLYTEAKFNGESLTTWEPRGTRQQLHLAMSKLGSTHIANVHILANLEPFRYGAQRFIQKCVQAARDRLGARGLHLYPMCYWNWPYSPDKTDPPLLQYKRDWIWFEAWARYTWNPDISEAEDHAYWVGRLADMYGTPAAAENILAAYNDSGECAPRLLRRFGITEGNRQTLSLGMTLDELVNPKKYHEFPELWESQSPPGERLQEYLDKEWNHQSHEGETPPQIIREALDFSAKAVAEIDAAAPSVTKDQAEFDRLRNDIYSIRAMSQFYAAKANAAMFVLRYGHSKDIADMEKAQSFLAESLDHYRELTRLTAGTYVFANSMQTSQRRIPVPGGVNGKPANYHWTQVLPVYENELAEFQKKVAAMKQGSAVVADESSIRPLPAAKFQILSGNAETYDVRPGAKVFTDRPFTIVSLAPELNGLTGIRFSHEQAKKGHYVPVEFETDQPVQVLIGYFQSSAKGWLQVPNLENDAAAIEHEEVEPRIENAATVESLPPVNVHVMKFGAGRHKLEVRGTGSFIVLGVVPQSAEIARRDAHRGGGQ